MSLSGNITVFSEGEVSLTLTQVGEEEPVNTLNTDSGSYRLDVTPGNYILTVSKTNHVTRQYTVTVGTEAVTLDVKLHMIGDVDGNGRINIGDVSKISGYIKDPSILTDEYMILCANINGGKINIGDVSVLYAHIKGTKKLY